MKRRNFVVGLGAFAAGGGVTVGSGAFSSVEAERTVTVETAGDDEAYLRLTEGKQARDDRSFRDTDGVLGFRFAGLREQQGDQFGTNPENPEGLGEDTVYRFVRETDGKPLFRAENQGTQTVEIYAVQENTQGVPDVQLFNSETGNLLTESHPYPGLSPGEHIPLGFEISTYGIEVRDDPFDIRLTIFAGETD